MTNRRRMVDLSSNNGNLDTNAHWRAGHRLLMRKVSEGVSYAWAAGNLLAAAWHRLGGILWHYHYLKSGIGGRQQAEWFWNNAKSQVRRYDRAVVDVEAMGNNWRPGEAAKCTQDFIQRMYELAPHIAGVVYSTSYFLRDNGVTPHRGWAFMGADYTGPIDFIPPGWKSWLGHQYTSAAQAAGISGGVDMSRLRPRALQPTLRQGDRCFAVLDAKHQLRRAGYRGFLVSSQQYGPGMGRAVRKYKRDHHLKNTNGAVFGARMWKETA